jgi:K+-sensing histidine kinase KdpD
MKFADVAAATIHDVKNQIALLVPQAEAHGDATMTRTLLGAANRLTRLLLLYKSETGHLFLDTQAHCPADLIDELAAEARSLSHLTVEIDVHASPPFWFYDTGLVRLALNNALHNALRHARSHIVLTAREQGDELCFEIGDDGEGYPEARLQSGAATAVSQAGSTGLGLYIAHLIAGQHVSGTNSGRVELSNQNGARFKLTLPR